MKRQRGYYYSEDSFLKACLAFLFVGGFVIYVAIPWLWRVAIKPALLWVLT